MLHNATLTSPASDEYDPVRARQIEYAAWRSAEHCVAAALRRGITLMKPGSRQTGVPSAINLQPGFTPSGPGALAEASPLPGDRVVQF